MRLVRGVGGGAPARLIIGDFKITREDKAVEKHIVACRHFARQRPVNSNRGTVFPVRFVPRCYKHDKLGVSELEGC
jgi:hypothetical protein